ncbi:hypothetical protein ACG873_24820 [Mesorhizobium sp. AaZ16]|uniref:hypothetical protein n=1 Tax=Mesorhizobium sp. AaZ16 TaxID=3402289 RepID=UPI00374FD7DB
MKGGNLKEQPEIWQLNARTSFRRLHYKVNASFEPHSPLPALPPTGWHPASETIPSAWPDEYLKDFGQPFEPSRFYLNCAQVLGFAAENPEAEQDCAIVLSELIETAKRYSLLHEGARFTRYDFEFPREGYKLSPGLGERDR